ncbi:hypothetical protein L228DRAFT_283937 [Xylona heveae TC161]|uniref:C3H1-type domain-containing protein n=1 Tax=Xylona heveae (strain CBS 132557 / TC161) TaxID=1328760 RepID=A0A165G6W3_XYLHT|nr:hypothetical protein L228DRAFT_283937 [Xylona heveae TC161]KZF21808.1 hypothetical protein L228DRAFT_283937 [Xylona heveae TC161]
MPGAESMDPFPQHPPSTQQHTPGYQPQDRISGHMQANGVAVPGDGNGNGPLAVPAAPPHTRVGNGHLRNPSGMARMGAFDGPRSPPGTKNTSHVPCKFFRQGACQAGKACPFLHSNDVTADSAPCKYFAKGNCKFGAKCALAHILPDGRRVNRPSLSVGGAHLNLGGRVNPQLYQNQESALAGSLLAQQANRSYPYGSQYQFSGKDNYIGPQSPHGVGFDIPTIDTSFASQQGSGIGSPRDDVRMPLSPAGKGLSALDAPLPASFDSQGVSWMARHGPVAASVPSKFGLESPPSSLPSSKVVPTSDALKNLHDSAFGEDTRNRFNSVASSPPVGNDEYFSARTLHSQRQAKPKMVSASLPRPAINEDWDDNFAFEEDLVPNSLHELLTPQEKMRRFSRTADEDLRLKFGGIGGAIGSPPADSSYVGSPITSSPSRFSALFSRQQQQKKEEEAAGFASGFGHVGSPLRNSAFNNGPSPSLNAVSRPQSGDVSPYVSSSPRQSSMSMISQQLQRTRLGGSSETPPIGGFHYQRHSSGNPSSRLDRAISSSSIGTSRIDEEQGDFVFSMEEEDDNKRYSSGFGFAVGDGRSSQSSGLAATGQRNGSTSTLVAVSPEDTPPHTAPSHDSDDAGAV